MQFSPQQDTAFATAVAWMRIRYAPFFYLAGYAGTGKSTLAMHFAEQHGGKVRYAAMTGKAAKVMRSKGCKGASMIHSLIYDVEEDETTGAVKFHLTGDRLKGVDLIIIDECSMVGEEMGKDLLSFGIPVIALGDPGQLPPIAGAGFFTSGTPGFMLTDVHRQAADSPIIRLATDVREGRYRREPLDITGLTICRRADLDPALVTRADTVLVGRNATRQRFNNRLREIRGFEGSSPAVGEQVICLKNDRDRKIANGETFRVSKLKRSRKTPYGKALRFLAEDPDDSARGPVDVSVHEHFFLGKERIDELPPKAHRGMQQFDFGYALTVHKSQGSQWDEVCVFDESQVFGADRNRHLYTAITRAAKRLTLVI